MIMATNAIPLRRAFSQDCDRNRMCTYDCVNQAINTKPLPPLEGVAKRKFNNESTTSCSPVKQTPSSPIPCPKSKAREEEAEAEAYLQDFYTRSTWQMYHRIKNARMAQARTTS